MARGHAAPSRSPSVLPGHGVDRKGTLSRIDVPRGRVRGGRPCIARGEPAKTEAIGRRAARWKPPYKNLKIKMPSAGNI